MSNAVLNWDTCLYSSVFYEVADPIHTRTRREASSFVFAQLLVSPVSDGAPALRVQI